MTARGIDISRADIIDALSMKYGVSVNEFIVVDLSDNVNSESTQGMSHNELITLLEEKDNKLKESENVASLALASIEAFRKQQQDLFGEFVILRQRYDEQKNAIMQCLWSHLTEHHPQVVKYSPYFLSPSFSHAHIFECS